MGFYFKDQHGKQPAWVTKRNYWKRCCSIKHTAGLQSISYLGINHAIENVRTKYADYFVARQFEKVGIIDDCF